MTLLALGINHRTASVKLREKVAFGPDVLDDALSQLRLQAGVSEAVILSTCNRTELYCNIAGSSEAQIRAWLCQYHGLEPEALLPSLYSSQGEQAVSHLMRVAAGLDSLVLGEPQILGQLKQAWQSARDADAVSSTLDRLFQRSFSVAKQVRTDTEIGTNAVSVAFAAVSLAKRIFERLDKTSVMLIGAGETIELVARHLHDNGVQKMMVANRTLGRAEQVAQPFGAEVMTLQQIPERLQHADVVIASTASPLPLLGKGAVENALRARRHRPMLLVDLAVPRDIEEAVGDLDDAFLYTVDDLQDMIEQNLRARQDAARDAERIIEQQAAQFMIWLRSLDAVETIRDYRRQNETIRDELLSRALSGLAQGNDPEQLLRQLANQLSNRLMHAPTRGLSLLGESGQGESLLMARALLGLERDPILKSADAGSEGHDETVNLPQA